MSFLAPLFFTALAALAVPILIHLIQREKKQVVFFPSLMFLDKIPYKSVQRRRIHNWALLLLRMAAIVMIITAFARPFLTGTTLASVAATGAREVVILVDRSYSMAYGDRWERAQAAVRQAVDGLAAGDRASLVFFGRGAQVEARSTDDRARLRLAIDSAEVGPDATRFAPALKIAQSILEQSQRSQREVFLVSDFQRTGWEGARDVRFPPGASLVPVLIADEKTANVAVSSIALQREEVSGQERITVTAGLQNKNDEPVTGLDVILEIDDLQVQSQRVALEAEASGSVTFPPLVLPASTARGAVRIAADALPTDDAFYFTIEPGRPIEILIVERSGGGRDPSFYVSGALGIGREPAFRVEVTSVERFRSDDLAGREVIILNDVPLSGSVPGRLQRFVEDGGGLFVILGDRSTWPNTLAVMPGQIDPVVDRGVGCTPTVGTVDFSHPVFELFRAPRSGGFEGTRVFRYRGLDVAAPGRVLARFDDGGVALAEKETGQGRVLVWTTTLDNLWSDLVLKPVFLPFLHRAMAYLARYEAPRPWRTVGQVFAERDAGTTRVALSPSGSRLPMGEAGAAGEILDAESGQEPIEVDSTVANRSADDGARNQQALLELNEQGFYEIRDAVGAEVPSTSIAVNVDTTESDLASLDPDELVAAVTGRAGGSEAAASDTESELRPVDFERRQALWWYLLVGGVLLLAAETLLSNRLSRATS